MPRTILLADDSVTIRKVVELTFSDTDIRVESVASGREALARLDALRPDLVLADVVMPGPSGYDVCRAVKASSRPVPVLLLTGTFEPFDPDQAKACGSDGHVTKPFDSRSLVERVEGLLAQGPATSPQTEDLEDMFDDLASPRPVEARDAEPSPPAAALRPAEPDSTHALAHATPTPAPLPVSLVEIPAVTAAPGGDLALTQGSAVATTLSPADIDAIARAVVARLSDRVLREIAWDVVPDLAEVVLRERIRELERDDRESS
jgi:CheY-like chemotaxis protein